MRRRVLWLASLAQLLIVLDTSVVNVALPSIQSELGLTDLVTSWLALVYTLGFAGVLLVGARLGDALGPAGALRWGIAGFVLASLAAGFAAEPLLLIIARATQGVCAAIASPATFALLTVTFPEGRERLRAIAWWTAASVAGGGIGNVLSGVLTQWLTWRAVFLVAVPIGALVLIGTRGIGRPPQAGRARIGALGAVLVTAAFTLTTYVLSSIDDRDRTWWLLALAALIVAAAAILHQSTTAEPLIPPSVWRNRTIVVGNLATLVAGMVFQVSIWYFLTFLLQHRLGLAPALTGLAFLPLTLTMIAINTWATPYLIERHAPRSIAFIGALVSAVGLTVPAVLPMEYPLLVILVPALIIGIGAGLFNAPLADLVTTGVTPAAAGAASGVMNTAKQFGGAIGLALLAAGTAGPADRSAFVLMAGLMLIAAVLVMVTPSPKPSKTPER